MMCAGLMAGLLAGCAPTPGVMSMQASTEQTQASLVKDGWTVLRLAVARSRMVRLYKVKMDVDVAQGPLHSQFSVYGMVHAPDMALLSFHSLNSNTRFYQQGKVAYVQEYKRWSQTSPMFNLDAFAPYQHIMTWAQARGVSVFQLPDTYVIDQYCHVYQATIPMAAERPLGLWNGAPIASGPSAAVLYTFYVGTKDGALHEVQTATVGAIAAVGAVEIDTDAMFFDFDNKDAEVKLPNDLFGQLVGMSHQG
ncbi:hypothetical protein GCM10010885_00590 [Alicyclobacillus cellulosilyticus]|uniref:Lipoprotein n=1 Tax=Alicyclobacillus cellulosilyticus TaxID=1003997 RepID=A0A917K2C1_9BACL|nr:hypothetical protein GCM10010885_00590 [Alicyclobacillus cellulosilyticus]